MLRRLRYCHIRHYYATLFRRHMPLPPFLLSLRLHAITPPLRRHYADIIRLLRIAIATRLP